MPFLKYAILNPVNVVDKNRVLAASNYNFKHFDGWLSAEQISAYMENRCYAQKWQTNDTIKLQVISDFDPIYVLMRGEDNKIKTTKPLTLKASIAGVNYFEVQLPLTGLAEGFYQMEMVCGEPTLLTLQSEPMWLKEIWEGTLLFNYSNKFNNNILWETGITMDFRVEGILVFDGADSVRTVYTDQPGNMTVVKGDAFRKFKLYVGNEIGVADWVPDKLEGIMDQNNMFIDGKGFAPVDGATWDPKHIDRYPFSEWNIQLRESLNRRYKEFSADGIQAQRVVIDYVVEGKLFGATYGDSNNPDFIITSVE